MASVDLEKNLKCLKMQESLRSENLTEYYFCKVVFLYGFLYPKRYSLSQPKLYDYLLKSHFKGQSDTWALGWYLGTQRVLGGHPGAYGNRALYLADPSQSSQESKTYSNQIVYRTQTFPALLIFLEFNQRWSTFSTSGDVFRTQSNIKDGTVCSCHVTYAFQSEFTLYSCLNVKERLARSRCEI